ncbi:hypothetical protein KF913_00540 [Candidatus Obscuribacterales bacterium]|nr:hypothetical protein [Candidatus Obscuribacterales bacterium]
MITMVRAIDDAFEGAAISGIFSAFSSNPFNITNILVLNIARPLREKPLASSILG